MSFLANLLGLEHGIVGRAKRSEAMSTEVWGVYIRESRDGYGVGVRHGANERLLTLEFYRDYEDAERAAVALSDYLGVAVEG